MLASQAFNSSNNPMDISEVAPDAQGQEVADARLESGLDPLVPVPGELFISRDQEKRLVEIALDRYRTAESTLTTGIGTKQGSWTSRREKAHRHYEGDFSDRQVPDSIYQHSNLSMNLPKRYSRITTARAYDELLSAEPMVAIIPEGPEDSLEETKVIERYCVSKINDAKVKHVLRDATMGACLRGETVVKITWKTKILRYKKRAEIMVNDEGMPVIARDGNPVAKSDRWIFDEETGDNTLAKDKDIVARADNPPLYVPMMATFTKTVHEGLDVHCINFKDFLCATTERDIHTADFIAHRFEWPIDQITTMLAPVADTPQARRYLRMLRTKQAAAKESRSAAAQPNDHRGESPVDSKAVPTILLAECYMRVALEPDGISDEIMVLLDVENGYPVFYDYLCNVSPTGRRPMEIVRLEPIPDRWYGTGLYELFADRHKFVDLFFNRVNFRSGISGNIRVENPFATEEGMAGEPIEFGSNKTYRLREGFDLKNVFRVITVPDDSTSSKDMLNMMLQTTQLEAGMVSGGDQGVGGLPSASLATGIRSLDRVANTILKNMFFDLIQGYEAVLYACAATALYSHSKRETEDLMGEEAAEILEKCRDIETLGYRVRLLLSNARDADVMESYKQAVDVVSGYYQLNPELQVKMRPLFLQILSSLQIEGADQLLGLPTEQVPPTEEQLALMQGGQGEPEVTQNDAIALESATIGLGANRPPSVGSMEKPLSMPKSMQEPGNAAASAAQPMPTEEEPPQETPVDPDTEAP